MFRPLFAAALLATALPLAAPPASAQTVPMQAISGTRLDIVATGEVSRVPDIVRINAGVMTQAPTGSEAIRQNADKMRALRAALRAAGVEERDIQTSSINLYPQWRHAENQMPQFSGYQAMNSVNVRFRDIANAGRIIDALVAAGANQIDGPNFEIDEPASALDEARTRAITIARERADLYARALGMRVKRILSVSEAGAAMPIAVMGRVRAMEAGGATNIAPGEQTLGASVTVSFELE
jgi:uncharacterized protein